MLATLRNGRYTRFSLPGIGEPRGQRLLTLNSNKKEELFTVTSVRWLYDEDQQRKVRHMPFNVEAFLDIAVKSAKARQCITINKLYESTSNRVFDLRFDNGVEFIAKIPFPTAGPRHLCTASEVATLDYLRSEHNAPVPKVRAWSSRPEATAVGTEYIMYEKIPGNHIDEDAARSLPLQLDPYTRIAGSLANLQSTLARTRFSQIGSLYYKEDVPEDLRNRPLYAAEHPSAPSGNSSRFCIGPTLNPQFWNTGRARLDIDRGPWPDATSYCLAISACARASVNSLPSDTENKQNLLRLISDFERLVPSLGHPDAGRMNLWHPDLRSENIIVAHDQDGTTTLQGLIDWQSSQILPHYMLPWIPPFYLQETNPLIDNSSTKRGPRLRPEAYHLPEPYKGQVFAALRSAWRALNYRQMVRDDPLLEEMLYGKRSGLDDLIYGPAFAVGESGPLAQAGLQYTLVCCRDAWREHANTGLDGTPSSFPLAISDAQAEAWVQEWEKSVRDDMLADGVRARFGIDDGSDGRVLPEVYEAAKRAVEEAKQALLDDALSPAERDRIARVWPMQDGKSHVQDGICW